MREPVRFANYPGNREQMLGGFVGPNDFGEMFVVVSVKYDPEADRSRVGFAFPTREDLKNAHERSA